ncbi:MAG: hypothetical protein IT314_03260 [Anaerolineales bacterium]|nr:hypothetical protein [Anaerolineales bacterium]
MPSKSFEQEIKQYFAKEGIKFEDASASYKRLDFTIFDKHNQPSFHLDVKEKRQKYNLKNWAAFAPEPDLFVLDDLTVRKCLAHAPNSGVLIRDNLREKYFFLSILDLALMPRLRVNRPINRNHLEVKGKWLINLCNAKSAASLERAVYLIRYYLRDMDEYLFDTLACYGAYVDETIETGGNVRKAKYWDKDVKATR